jgi:hypothetical protein
VHSALPLSLVPKTLLSTIQAEIAKMASENFPPLIGLRRRPGCPLSCYVRATTILGINEYLDDVFPDK